MMIMSLFLTAPGRGIDLVRIMDILLVGSSSTSCMLPYSLSSLSSSSSTERLRSLKLTTGRFLRSKALGEFTLFLGDDLPAGVANLPRQNSLQGQSPQRTDGTHREAPNPAKGEQPPRKIDHTLPNGSWALTTYCFMICSEDKLGQLRPVGSKAAGADRCPSVMTDVCSWLYGLAMLWYERASPCPQGSCPFLVRTMALARRGLANMEIAVRSEALEFCSWQACWTRRLRALVWQDCSPTDRDEVVRSLASGEYRV